MYDYTEDNICLVSFLIEFFKFPLLLGFDCEMSSSSSLFACFLHILCNKSL